MQINFIKGDITRQKVDAIVNAANSSLMGGGGVDGAIHQAGGPQILGECHKIIEKIGRLETGKAVITTGGNLPAKYVIHTVGPIYREGKDQVKELADCYLNSLKLAEEKKLQSIAFPSISTGVYRYPLGKAAPIAVGAVKDFFKENPNSSIKEVHFILFNDETYEAYARA